MTVLYNEIDPYAAAWLRNLIAAGHIAAGVVDERSIVELDPDYLRGFVQCHFFAGIGIWSHALRRAGWADERPVWTGSCPCQPFSAAGKGEGHEDERHLWPAWQRLISECRPAAVLGEQVAGAAGLGWLDVVLTDMEALDYAVAAADLCAAGVGAPHIRQRLYFVAHSGRERGEPHRLDMAATTGSSGGATRQQRVRDDAGAVDLAGMLAHADGAGQRQQRLGGLLDGERPAERAGVHAGARILADAELHDGAGRLAEPHGRPSVEPHRHGAACCFWADADWIPCRDGKTRPVEPGTFPLAHGAPARVGRLRAYGNAIVGPLAAEFIKAALTC